MSQESRCLSILHTVCKADTPGVAGCNAHVLHEFYKQLTALCMQMHLGMVAVMNAAIDLEDPFSTKGVDGIYCDENLYEVEQVSSHTLQEGLRQKLVEIMF